MKTKPNNRVLILIVSLVLLIIIIPVPDIDAIEMGLISYQGQNNTELVIRNKAKNSEENIINYGFNESMGHVQLIKKNNLRNIKDFEIKVDFSDSDTVGISKLRFLNTGIPILSFTSTDMFEMFTSSDSQTRITEENGILIFESSNPSASLEVKERYKKQVHRQYTVKMHLAKILIKAIYVACIVCFGVLLFLISSKIIKKETTCLVEKTKPLLYLWENNFYFRLCSAIIFAFLLAFIAETLILPIIVKFFNLNLHVGFATLKSFFSPVEYISWSRIYFFNICLMPFISYVALGNAKFFKYRYVIAFLFLILMVSGQFTGSSLGCFDELLFSNTAEYEKSTLLGIPRMIRGDEWATVKPYYFAQANMKSPFPYYNTNMGIDGMDMVISGFAPVKDIIILVRPELWGFLFLPPSYAFSFYWWLRLVMLFMANFELLYILTKKRFGYAVVGSLSLLMMPSIQWWLSQTPTLMLTAGSYAVVMYYYYLRSDTKLKEYSYLFGIAFFLTMFIFTIYPAEQIPYGYLYLAILAYIIIDNWSKKPFALKRFLHYGLILIYLIAFIARFFIKSGEAIQIQANTTYPGSGNQWIPIPWDFDLYSSISAFTASVRHSTYINSSEISQAWSLLPFTLLASIVVIVKEKKEALLQILLTLVIGFLWVVSRLKTLPWALGNIFLFRFTYPIRITIIYGIAGVILLFTLLPYFEEYIRSKNQKLIMGIISIGLFAILSVLSLFNTDIMEYFEYMKVLLFIVISFTCILGYLLLAGGKKKIVIFSALYLSFTLWSTVWINPITKGTDSMFEKNTISNIKKIDEQESGRWVVSGHTTISNLVTALGVERSTGTYYYPDLDMMEIIDPNQEYIDLYNQYAHIDIIITADDYSMEKQTGVSLKINLPIKKAKDLNVKYIFADNDKFLEKDILLAEGHIELLFEDKVDNWSIYKLA